MRAGVRENLTAPPTFRAGLARLADRLVAEAETLGDGRAVERRALERALRPSEVDELEAAGILRPVAPGRVVATVRLERYGPLLLASDLESSPDPARVSGITRVSAVLAALTVRTRVGAALDLGAGMGIHALLAARHCARAEGVDVNPRAVAFARFNAALNGIDNVEFRRGDWSTAIEGAAVDLLTAAPAGRAGLQSVSAFHRSGLADDSDAHELVRRSAGALREGGLALVFRNRLHRGPSGWGPFEELLEGAACDALLLVYDSCEPLDFVVRQHGVLGRLEPSAAEALRERWARHYREREITASAWGVVVLRKRHARGWRSTLVATESPQARAGEHLERIFAGHDALAGAQDARALLDLPVALAPGAGIVRRLGGGHAHDDARVQLADGAGVEARVGAATLEAIERTRDGGSLRDAISAPQLRRGVAEDVRSLLARGVLERRMGRSVVPG